MGKHGGLAKEAEGKGLLIPDPSKPRAGSLPDVGRTHTQQG